MGGKPVSTSTTVLQGPEDILAKEYMVEEITEINRRYCKKSRKTPQVDTVTQAELQKLVEEARQHMQKRLSKLQIACEPAIPENWENRVERKRQNANTLQ